MFHGDFKYRHNKTFIKFLAPAFILTYLYSVQTQQGKYINSSIQYLRQFVQSLQLTD